MEELSIKNEKSTKERKNSFDFSFERIKFIGKIKLLFSATKIR